MKQKTKMSVIIMLLLWLCACGSSTNSANISEESHLNSRPVEEENIASDKIKRDGFDEATNQNYSVGDITFSIPAYYTNERQNGDGTFLYAETGDATAMLMLNFENLDVAYLSSADLTTFFDSFIEGLLHSMNNAELLDSKDVTIAGLPGRTATFSSDTGVEGDAAHMTSIASYALNIDTKQLV